MFRIIMADNAYFWLLKQAERHEAMARYFRVAATTWRTVTWDGQQQHKPQENSGPHGSIHPLNTKPTEQTSDCNESSRNGRKP